MIVKERSLSLNSLWLKFLIMHIYLLFNVWICFRWKLRKENWEIKYNQGKDKSSSSDSNNEASRENRSSSCRWIFRWNVCQFRNRLCFVLIFLLYMPLRLDLLNYDSWIQTYEWSFNSLQVYLSWPAIIFQLTWKFFCNRKMVF